MKFRKKPVVIDAFQYKGEPAEAIEWVSGLHRKDLASTYLVCSFGKYSDELFVNTLEGKMLVPVGNYIVCGVEGELYSCDPVIFLKTNEPVTAAVETKTRPGYFDHE